MATASMPARARMPRLAAAALRTQPDRRLTALAGEGSHEAFEELVRRYGSSLLAFARGVAPAGSADDVLQDSMLKAHQALARGDRPDHPRAWLYRIVRNTALNERRDNRPHERLDDDHDGVEQPPQAAERRAQLAALLRSLRQLPAAQREAIVKRELEGRGHDEIAVQMGASPGAVRQLIFRARETLRAAAGALLPLQLLRLATLQGAMEPLAGGAGGAAGAGIGLTSVKLGLGAMLATGAIVGGFDADLVGGDQGGAPPSRADAPPHEQLASGASGAADPGARGAATAPRTGSSGRSSADGAPGAARRPLSVRSPEGRPRDSAPPPADRGSRGARLRPPPRAGGPAGLGGPVSLGAKRGQGDGPKPAEAQGTGEADPQGQQQA